MEMLWKDCFSGICTEMQSEEERALTKKALECYQVAKQLLSETQFTAIEKHIDALCEIQDHCVKKAFFKGCEFTLAFLLEAGNPNKS